MTISATIIADSISQAGIRLTTFQLRYPRFVHAEFMTHRVFSRNASSSRAIPVERLIEDIRKDPAMPVHWGKNQRGMQAHEEHSALVNVRAVLGVSHDFNQTPEKAWLFAMQHAIAFAEAFSEAGYHKQIVNRLLEPFSHINVVVTATQFSNFFALRDHPDAQPEICFLAQAMKAAMADSTPKVRIAGLWHLPYVTDDNIDEATRYLLEGRITRDMPRWEEVLAVLQKISVARCARVSYKTHDGRTASIEEEVALCDRLLAQVPLHASPAEHQATPDIYDPRDEMLARHADDRHVGSLAWTPYWNQPELHGNFTGWRQYRKMLPGECQ